eukprot:TRINITY_DN5953_c0_g2_i1.p1 TRINITY_DN5953_c0_g2~~TRINITY_DN5953_c0_g2_i1.p1  ORF type:complete len:813 (+),score=241.72 TRINITY_DN5953_c0_g2_i1:58-2439(+)
MMGLGLKKMKEVDFDVILQDAQHDETGVETKVRTYHLRSYPDTFVGRDLVTWLVGQKYAKTRDDAVKIGNDLLDANRIRHCTGDHGFRDKKYFYNFVKTETVEEPSVVVLTTPNDRDPHSAELNMFVVGRLLHSNLEETLDRQLLETVDEQCLLDYMPFVMGCLRRLGESRESQQLFSSLVETFLRRVSANRTLKLRFLLLTSNKEYEFWKITKIFDRDCYARAKELRSVKQEEFALNPQEEGSDTDDTRLSVGEVSTGLRIARKSAYAATKMEDLEDEQSLRALARRIFADDGVALIDRRKMLDIKSNSFLASDMVDWMMSHLEIKTRAEAVVLAERMKSFEIIGHERSNKLCFLDGIHYYTYNCVGLDSSNAVTVHANVVKRAGLEGGVIFKAKNTSVGGVKSTIYVDLVDVQTLKFLVRTVNDITITEKQLLGPLQICHPYADVSVTAGDTPDILQVKVLKVFSSIAAPVMMSLLHLPEMCNLDDPSAYQEVTPRIIVKKGDNLFQDMCVENMFRVFNQIWNTSPDLFGEDDILNNCPFIRTYEITPTGDMEGFMEVNPSVVSFKEFSWQAWVKSPHGQDDVCVNNMVCSAAGAYIGCYLLGVRDRHWDNVLIKDNCTLFHIDFGFLLGTAPPIDAPRFSISESMKAGLESIGKWDYFLDKCVDAFTALRRNAPVVLRAATRLFGTCGWEAGQVKTFLSSDGSLYLSMDEEAARSHIRSSLKKSPQSWKNLFKQFGHSQIDPIWYGLLKAHFPPAEYTMKLVEGSNTKKMNKSKLGASDKFGTMVDMDSF